LRHVLLHELAHVERRDARGHALLNLAFPVLFVHPLYWLLRRHVHFARELIADDWAAGFDTPQSYAEGLIGWLRQHGSAPAAVSAGLGILGASPFRNQFSRRMKMLIDRKKPLLARTSLRWSTATILAGTALVVALASVLGNSPSVAQQPPTQVEDTPKQQAVDDSPRETRSGKVQPGSDEILDSRAEELEEPDELSVSGSVGIDLSRFDEGKITVRSCSVELMYDARISAMVEGALASLDVREGSRVKQGQTLARLEDRKARLGRDVAVAEYETAREELTDVNVRFSEASLQVAEQDVKRLEELARRNEVPATEVIRAKLAMKRAKLQVEQAQTDQKAAKAQLKVYALRVAAAEADLSRYHVRALQDGIVVETFGKVGQWLKPGDPILRVVRLDRLRLATSIPSEVWIVTPDDQNRPRQERKILYDSALLDGKKITVVVETRYGKRHGKRRLAAGRVFLAPLPVKGQHRLTVEVENRQEDGRWVLQPTDRPTLLIEPAKAKRPSK
jgi:multidrug efflux pump subunit AcrA (membrane-fusion protein)